MQQLIDFLNSLWGAPAFIMVGLACLVFGYVLRLIPVFPNKWIPATVILIIGPVFQLLMAEALTKGEVLRVWWAKNFIEGLVMGFLVWITHDKLISRFESSIPILGNLLARTDPPAPVPAVPQPPTDATITKP